MGKRKYRENSSSKKEACLKGENYLFQGRKDWVKKGTPTLTNSCKTSQYLNEKGKRWSASKKRGVCAGGACAGRRAQVKGSKGFS